MPALTAHWNVGPSDGAFFVDLLNRSDRGPTGAVVQGLSLDPDSDYEFAVHVETSRPLFPGPVTIRVTVEDAASITRFRWERTSNPSGSGRQFEKFTFRFDTSGWVMVREVSGAIYIEAPRELNPGRTFLGIDQASLFLLQSIISRFRR